MCCKKFAENQQSNWKIIANKSTEQALCQEIHNTVIWNNKFICIQGKSIFCEALFNEGIITL